MGKILNISNEQSVIYSVLIAIVIFIFIYFTPNLLFNNFTPTGGDYGSHLVLANYARENLFNGKLIGLYPNWMAGMPMFQFYFILPYVLMALLSYIIPLNIAFKLISILGIISLPFCVYFCLKLLKFKFPVPILGAISSLFLLFDGSYSVWGGNIKSTLAGQISHSIGISLTILFLGTLYYGCKERKLLVTNIIILALILLSHLYTFIIALFIIVIVFLIFLIKRNLEAIKYIIKMGIVSCLLTTFWTIPFIAKLPFSSAPKDIWYGSRLFSLIFKEYFIVFYILAIFALFFYSYSLYRYKFPKSIKPKKKVVKKTAKNKAAKRAGKKIKRIPLNEEIEPFFYILITLIAVFIFTIIISESRLLNIRFIPFINLLIFLAAAVGIGKLVFWQRAKYVLPLVVLLISFAIIIPISGDIKGWAKWNMEGVENKQNYEDFRGVNEFLKNDDFSGRIQFEYSREYNNMGTPRVFESSPLYHKKPVIEALLLESCLTFPFHYYLEKEMSKDSWWPGFNITEPKNNITKGVQDLRLYNVKRFVAYTDHSKELIDKQNITMLSEIGHFNIYSINEDSEYVEQLKKEPILVMTDDWKQRSFDWFDLDHSVFLVFKNNPDEKDKEYFRLIYDDINREKKLDEFYEESQEIEDCSVEYELDEDNEFIIDTDCIGKPLLVKFSYYPNWQAKGARVYLSTPNLIVIVPEQEHVELSYRATFPDLLGSFLTLLGFITLIYLIVNQILIWKK